MRMENNVLSHIFCSRNISFYLSSKILYRIYENFKDSSEQDMAWYVRLLNIYYPQCLLLQSPLTEMPFQILVPPTRLGAEEGMGVVGSHYGDSGGWGSNLSSSQGPYPVLDFS